MFFTRYRPPSLRAPDGSWPGGECSPVTVLVAAYDEQEGIERTLEHIAESGITHAVTVRSRPPARNATAATPTPRTPHSPR
jgi:hypothetical protein